MANAEKQSTKGKGLVILLSGGQDSATCLAWALNQQSMSPCHGVTFRYSQMKDREIKAAAKLSELAGITHEVIAADVLSEPRLIPARNMIMLTLASAIAIDKGYNNIAMGILGRDYTGHTDRKPAFIHMMNLALLEGLDYELTLYAPLLDMNKAQTVKKMEELGHVDWHRFTHSCFQPQFPPCGECAGCRLRSKGFQEAGVIDPLALAGIDPLA